MAHTVRDKKKLLHRIRRIRGQMDAVERALEAEQECIEILQLMTACRGALNSLMAELVEGHFRFHVMNGTRRSSSRQQQEAEELTSIIRKYLK
jgi:DNA-binding FrmR family transcriptional regulator